MKRKWDERQFFKEVERRQMREYQERCAAAAEDLKYRRKRYAEYYDDDFGPGLGEDDDSSSDL